MSIHSRLPDDSYAVVLSISGDVEHRVAGEVFDVNSGVALVQSPLQPVEARTPQCFELLFLKFPRSLLESELEKMLGRPHNVPLVFSPRFSLKSEAGAAFRKLLLTLASRVGREELAHTVPSVGNDLPMLASQGQLVTLLLESQRHNYTRMLVRFQQADPWQVRAAEEYMSANAHQALTLGDVCSAAGVSARTLQHSFRKKRGHTPMQFLRRVRLQRVHADLSHPTSSTTVTNAASHWGFLHFGRFAAEYQMVFGEKPSATLQSARSRMS